MNVTQQQRMARIIFWVAQIIGTAMVLLLVLFIGGSLISEVIDPNVDTNIRENYGVFLLLLVEICAAVAIIISWKRTKPGAYLLVTLTILIFIFWGKEDINFIILHIPLLVSGILLMFYAYYKERIIKE